MTLQQNFQKKKKEKRCWKFWQLGIWTRSWLFQALSRHVLPPAASLTRCQRMPCLINTVCKGCWRGHRALLIKRKWAFQSRCILMKGKVSLVCSMGMGKPHMWILPWMLDLCGFHHTWMLQSSSAQSGFFPDLLFSALASLKIWRKALLSGNTFHCLKSRLTL